MLAHLEPARAAGVLRRLPPQVQAEVIHRLVDLGEADPEALREVEQGLLSRLGAAPLSRPREGGLDKVAAILESSSHDARRDLIRNLSAHAPDLGLRWEEPQFTFADLAQLDGWALAEVLAAADPEVLILALAGAAAEFAQAALRRLPTRKARLVRQALQNLGPTRLSDLEQAQQELANLAQRLESQGRLSLPNGRRLSLTG